MFEDRALAASEGDLMGQRRMLHGVSTSLKHTIATQPKEAVLGAFGYNKSTPPAAVGFPRAFFVIVTALSRWVIVVAALSRRRCHHRTGAPTCRRRHRLGGDVVSAADDCDHATAIVSGKASGLSECFTFLPFRGLHVLPVGPLWGENNPHPHAEAKPTSYARHPLWYRRARSFLAAVERAMVQTDHHFDEDDTRHKRDGHHDDVSAPRRDPDRNNPDAAAYDPNPSPDHHATADARWGDGEVTNDLSDRGHDGDDNDDDGRGCEDDDATTTKRRRRLQLQRRREDEDVTTTTTTGRRQRCGDRMLPYVYRLVTLNGM
ncbi:hypothetical protein EDB83DRAFT_2605242 [Lactarius deliciosus]|nr:hypothetical protein EDB83DRAFT_2605242 [Lactarius deliciosus]